MEAPVASDPRAHAPARWVARAGLAAAGLLAGAVLVLTVGLPALTGGAARTVRSGSMAPAIPVGALVLDRPVKPADLRVGDVVTYGIESAGRRSLVTHRIVAIDRTVSPPLLTLRGDANATDDATRIPVDAVRGRVWFVVPWLGGAGARLAALRWALVIVAGGAAVTVALIARQRRGPA